MPENEAPPTATQLPKNPPFDPAKLFHLVEAYLVEKQGFKSVSVVDPAQMATGYVFAYGVKDGKAIQVRVAREDVVAFAAESGVVMD